MYLLCYSVDGDKFWLSINNMAVQAMKRDAYIGEKNRQVRDGKLSFISLVIMHMYAMLRL